MPGLSRETCAPGDRGLGLVLHDAGNGTLTCSETCAWPVTLTVNMRTANNPSNFFILSPWRYANAGSRLAGATFADKIS